MIEGKKAKRREEKRERKDKEKRGEDARVERYTAKSRKASKDGQKENKQWKEA